MLGNKVCKAFAQKPTETDGWKCDISGRFQHATHHWIDPLGRTSVGHKSLKCKTRKAGSNGFI